MLSAKKKLGKTYYIQRWLHAMKDAGAFYAGIHKMNDSSWFTLYQQYHRGYSPASFVSLRQFNIAMSRVVYDGMFPGLSKNILRYPSYQVFYVFRNRDYLASVNPVLPEHIHVMTTHNSIMPNNNETNDQSNVIFPLRYEDFDADNNFVLEELERRLAANMRLTDDAPTNQQSEEQSTGTEEAAATEDGDLLYPTDFSISAEPIIYTNSQGQDQLMSVTEHRADLYIAKSKGLDFNISPCPCLSMSGSTSSVTGEVTVHKNRKQLTEPMKWSMIATCANLGLTDISSHKRRREILSAVIRMFSYSYGFVKPAVTLRYFQTLWNKFKFSLKKDPTETFSIFQSNTGKNRGCYVNYLMESSHVSSIRFTGIPQVYLVLQQQPVASLI